MTEQTMRCWKRLRHAALSQPVGRRSGQALVEYALILILVALAAGVTLAATGPAIGNIFSNVLFNVVGQDPDSIVPLANGRAVAFWATVEFVATNPQRETPFPTPIDLPATLQPTSYLTPTFTNTPTPTNTHTNTYTPTNTFTPSNTFTYTPGPTSTPGDYAFTVPHVDLSDKREWWRLDNAFGIGGGQWAATYYATTNFTGTTYTNTEYLAANGFISNNWGTGSPAGSPSNVPAYPAGTTRFSAVYDKTFINNGSDLVRIDYVIGAGDTVDFVIDGTSQHTDSNGTSSSINGTFDYTFTSGTHTIQIRYTDAGGGSTEPAELQVSMSRKLDNPEDTQEACAWSNLSDASGSNTSPLMWVEGSSLGSTNWSAGQTCVLELRGSVDLSTAANPKLSFWDVWDFTTNTGALAELQVGNYTTDANGFFNRSAANWQTIPLRAGGSANYNWTRTQIDLLGLGLTNRITFRFVLTSSALGQVRWNIDDIQVLSDPTPPIDDRTFTVGDVWDLNSRGQMNDFFFNSDANYTREVSGGALEGWRWNLTNTNTHSGTGFDGSPGGTFAASQGSSASPDDQRLYFIEFRRPIDVTTTRSPAVPVLDYENDSGAPVLTFWQAYDVGTGGSLAVQYTRDPINSTSGALATWTTVPDDGLLLNSSGGAPASNNVNDAGAIRSDLTMQEVQVRLAKIPNYNTSQFRLRLVLSVDPGATGINDWYVDDIRFEREDSRLFENYPMLDDAENATAAASRWTTVGPTGVWGRTSTRGGYNSTTAFADSPGGSYVSGTSTAIEMQRTIDLLNDTPANDPPDGEPSSRAAAINPMLSFWLLNDLENARLLVDVWSARTNQWRQVWVANVAGRGVNNAWFRVEVNLQQALIDQLRATTGDMSWQWGGSTATSIAGNACDSGANLLGCMDDDIRVRIRLDATGATSRDGVYVDDIRIEDNNPYVHRLWVGGDGTYSDTVDTRTPNLGTANDTVAKRWYLGGTFGTTSATARSGALSVTESPGATNEYVSNGNYVLELRPIIDLTSTVAADLPSLSFFSRYAVGSGDGLRLEIAVQNPGDTSQGFDKLAGYGAWTPVTPGSVTSNPGPWNTSTPTPDLIQTWFRGNVNLSTYVGQKIRIRFVLRSDAATQADGLYIDDLLLSPRVTNRTQGNPQRLTEFFAGTGNWIFEGNWSTTDQYFTSNNPGSGSLGNWEGFFVDCESYSASCNDVSMTSGAQKLLNDNQVEGFATNYNGPYTNPAIFGDLASPSINEWLGTSRPHPQADARFDDSWAARWRLQNVTLVGGATYRVYTISDDGVILRISDRSGTNIPAGGETGAAGRIINNWTVHSATPQLDYMTFTVTGGSIQRDLTLDYFEDLGNAYLALSFASGGSSVTDSPNAPGSTSGAQQAFGDMGYTTLPMTNYGLSALVLNGVIDLSGTSGPFLRYTRYYNLSANTNFRVEFSSDGGFTWTAIASENLDGDVDRLPPANDWETRTVPIAGGYRTGSFAVRFRLDTRAAGGGGTDDGVWVGSVEIIG